MKLWAVLLAISFSSGVAHAEEPLPPFPDVRIEPIPAGEDVIKSVRKGQPVPFDGQLFDPATALRWSNYLKQYDSQVTLLRDTSRRLCLIEVEHREELLRLERQARKQDTALLMSSVERLEKKNVVLQAELLRGTPWHKSRTFGIVLGAAGSAVLFGASVWALSEVSR